MGHQWGGKSFWGGTWWSLFSNPGKLVQNKPFQVNSFLEEARCSELLLFVSLGVITLYIKLTQDFPVTVWNSVWPSCWQIPTSLLRMAAESFMWSIRLSFNSILISNIEFQFSFLLWFHHNKYTSKTETIVLIQAQKFCGRKSCLYTKEASLQKNNILIKTEMQICLLPKPTFLS